MLINLSNHNSELWKNKQKKAALKQFGNIIDILHPKINPNWNLDSVQKKAEKYVIIIIKMIQKSKEKDNVVHLMGESTFTYQLLTLLRKEKIKSIASTTKRIVCVDEKGNKISGFEFVKFRYYY